MEKTIGQEVVQLRKFQSRPYIFPLEEAPHEYLQELDSTLAKYGIPFDDCGTSIFQAREVEKGQKDLMVTSLTVGYLIASSTSKTGIKIMPDRLIVPSNTKDEFVFWTDFYRKIKDGKFTVSNFKSGEYGTVGFNPVVDGRPYPNLCIKLYNFAYPYSQQAWDTYRKDSVKINRGGGL